MNFVKMAAGHDPVSELFMKIQAEGVTRGIVDDDNGVFILGENAGYKVVLYGSIPDPVVLQSGTPTDMIKDSVIDFILYVEDPDGNVTEYVPDVVNSQAAWKIQS